MASENTTAGTSRQKAAKPEGANKILATLVVVMAAVTVYLYIQYSNLKADPAKEAQAEAAELAAQVGKLIVLPDEQPTVATVTDVEKLKDQPFFAKAQNGNKVLIYTQAKKAILFDPIANKIIEVAPINIGDSTKAQAKPAPAPAPTPEPVAPAPSTEAGSDTTPQ